MKTGTAPDWADEKAKRLLDDPWGKGVAGDIVDGVARALRDAHAEGMNEAEQIAKKHAEYGMSGWHKMRLCMIEEKQSVKENQAK